MRRMRWIAALVALFVTGVGASACREVVDYNSGNIGFDPDRPEVPEVEPVDPYDGDDPIVLEAQQRFPTGLDLHEKVIWRTCTPNGGVCHNSSEYPDLRTPGNFASAFGAFCNVQPGEHSSVYDGCERPGDRVRFAGGLSASPAEIAWIEQIPGEDREYDAEPPEDAPGLHIHLVKPLDAERNNGWSTVHFARTFVEGNAVQEIEYATFQTWWHTLGDGTHVFGRVRGYQLDEVQNLLEVGIVEGDANRNGIAGASLGLDVSMLAPGRPEDSYLIARIRGQMFDDKIPGSRMPLANPPLTIPEMLGLYCLVEGWPNGADQTFLSGMIDYRNCSYSSDPESLNLLGDGVTWTSRVQPILEANCGGCHSETEAQGNLVLVGEGVYERLLGASEQLPDLPLIAPGLPEESYLYLKLIDDDQIIGNPMPYNPLTGEGRLTEAELGDILTWIINGAVEDE
jgi:hypothetical protein